MAEGHRREGVLPLVGDAFTKSCCDQLQTPLEKQQEEKRRSSAWQALLPSDTHLLSAENTLLHLLLKVDLLLEILSRTVFSQSA